jgi:hypothetical protein
MSTLQLSHRQAGSWSNADQAAFPGQARELSCPAALDQIDRANGFDALTRAISRLYGDAESELPALLQTTHQKKSG